MAKTPELAAEAQESGNKNLDDLSKQVSEKEKAKQLPDKVNAKNQSFLYAGKSGTYNGERLRGGKDNVNNPCGKGKFVSGDGIVVDGEWNNKGQFLKGTVKANGRTYNITNTKIYTSNGEMASLGGTCYCDTISSNYGCTLDENFKLSKIRYAGVDISLEHSGSKAYLKSSKGRLELGSVDDDVAACRIAKCISIVKNSGYHLSYFETDGGDELQADYENKAWDTDLLKNCTKMTGVSAYKLVDWLNACRHSDFGI